MEMYSDGFRLVMAGNAQACTASHRQANAVADSLQPHIRFERWTLICLVAEDSSERSPQETLLTGLLLK